MPQRIHFILPDCRVGNERINRDTLSNAELPSCEFRGWTYRDNAGQSGYGQTPSPIPFQPLWRTASRTRSCGSSSAHRVERPTASFQVFDDRAAEGLAPPVRGRITIGKQACIAAQGQIRAHHSDPGTRVRTGRPNSRGRLIGSPKPRLPFHSPPSCSACAISPAARSPFCACAVSASRAFAVL